MPTFISKLSDKKFDDIRARKKTDKKLNKLLENKACGLYDKHITIVNDNTRLMLQIVGSHLRL
jgi:hypothetical protein